MASSYHKGRSREYRAMKRLREEGWLCSRTARSHGPFDLIAGKDGRVKLIQVKSGSGRMKREEEEEFRLWAEAFGAEAELWYYGERGRLERRLIHDGRSKRSKREGGGA